MITQRRLIPHLLTYRSNHNLISFLRNPQSAVRKARAVKATLQKNCEDGKFPKRFSRKTQVNSRQACHLYLVNNETATKIAQHLTESIDLSKTFVETNPGLGLLTNLLVQSGMTDLRLFESQSDFCDDLQKTYTNVHPDRVKLKHFDLINLGRSFYIDQLTGDTRSDKILSELPSSPWDSDINFTMFGATGSNAFFWNLIYSIIFQNSILAHGRCELYMVMPSITYVTLTSSNSSALEHYRSLSILFQIFFEYRLLDKFPRAHFLPYITNSLRLGSLTSRVKQNIKGIQLTTVDPELMYFVKIVPRRDLYKWCPLKHIQELWHFVERNCYVRVNRIIPLLEKLIPGCGTRLLLNFCTKEPVRPQRVHEIDLLEIPPTTNPSMTLSDRDYYDDLNIYTQFADLQPTHILTLFHEFRRLPEFSNCSFLTSLEQSILKRTVLRMDVSSEQKGDVNSKTDQNSVVK